LPAAQDRRRRARARSARFGGTLLLLLICSLACAENPAGQADPRDGATPVVLAPGESRRIPETDLTISFLRVVEDSRCPTGVTCIREGDAAVLLRVDKPGTNPSEMTLHTSGPGAVEQSVDNVTVRLAGVMPYPAADSKPRPEEYRVTLLIRKK
jgi:hypothetical protein